MAYHSAAFRQDLPATPANMPLNYFYPPPEQSSYIFRNGRGRHLRQEEIQRKEEERKRAIEEKVEEKKTKREFI